MGVRGAGGVPRRLRGTSRGSRAPAGKPAGRRLSNRGLVLLYEGSCVPLMTRLFVLCREVKSARAPKPFRAWVDGWMDGKLLRVSTEGAVLVVTHRVCNHGRCV